MKQLFVIFLLLLNFQNVYADFPVRKYIDNQILVYKMRGINDGRHYEAISHHKVQTAKDVFYEEVTWKSLQYEGEEIDLSSMKDFKQLLSLDKNFTSSMPDISAIDPKLLKYILGPIYDLMTFYVDLNPRLFDSKIKDLQKGITLTIPYNKPSSWADGHRVILGEDCINFRLTFQDSENRKPLLRVEHIPPLSDLNINFPETWMENPVSKLGHNNWIQIIKTQNPQRPYLVSYGYEYFDVHIYIDPEDGKIFYAEMYNPVEKINRIAEEVSMENKRVTKVKNLSEPFQEHTFRNISLEFIKTER